MDTRTVSRNENYTIAELSRRVQGGQFRIPEFQRAFRWDEKDVLALLDSIMKGYPFGSFLLWQKPAPQASIRVGALSIQAESRTDALWVVDGQQRLTSLVNVIDSEAAQHDPRFAISFNLEEQVMQLSKDVPVGAIAIPVPDLFSLGRALAWLQENPHAQLYTAQIQAATETFNNVTVPCTLIEQGEESVLRDIFDRINSRGKRLNKAEVFEAINVATDSDNEALSLEGVLSSINAKTSFGIPDDTVVLQAVLVRRHPDISRDIHAEFNSTNFVDVSLQQETREAALAATEDALLKAIDFLQHGVGVPHFSFVPFRFQLLVLTRFFAYFPTPHPRNLELLKRWFWRSSVNAKKLKLSGRTTDVRSLAQLIQAGQENDSVSELVRFVTTEVVFDPSLIEDFRTNQSTAKMRLIALWSLHPVNPVSREALTTTELSEFLGNSTTPAEAVISLTAGSTTTLANRVISVVDRSTFIENLDLELDLESLCLDTHLVELLQEGQDEEFITKRGEKLQAFLEGFLHVAMGTGFEDTPPLAAFDLDGE